MSSLIVADVVVGYGRSDVLFDVSLDVSEGDLVCLMGRNGVGKTTLLNAIVGLLPARSGSISHDGCELGAMTAPKRARRGIGYVPQGHAVFPQLTTRENLLVVAERSGRVKATAFDEVIDLFPALATLLARPAGLLSGGQAKQLAIARALVTRPDILILDEPTEGIQPSIIHQIEDTIAMLHASLGMTMLLVEQYVEFALRLADRFAVMDGGRIVASGDTAHADPAQFAGLIAI
ncbi:MAG: urea transport system ATP-binding protein [Candidatus Poriferisodalaceae bacterium]